jgi:hypothetical protein
MSPSRGRRHSAASGQVAAEQVAVEQGAADPGRGGARDGSMEAQVELAVTPGQGRSVAAILRSDVFG